MSWRVTAISAILVVLFTGRSANACAGCSNPNLPSARGGVAILQPWELSVAINLTGTTMHVVHSEYCPEIGPICSQRAEPPQLHDQRFYVAELRPILGLGISKIFSAELQVPARVLRTTIQFRRLDGTPFTPDYENIHHRNETLVGFGDPWLLGRVTGMFGKFGITSRIGAGLPLGSTEPDPFALGRAGFPHEHIQFGTGTVYPIFALDASYKQGPARLSGYGQVLLFLYENGYGYRAGNRYSGGIFGEIEVLPRFRVGLSSDLLNEQPERWSGVVQQDGNVGRTDLLVGGSVSYTLGTVSLSASVKAPVWQHFIETTHDHGGDPGQLTYPAIINLAVSTTFGGKKPDAPKSGVLPAL
jgi:hypothetical protein